MPPQEVPRSPAQPRPQGVRTALAAAALVLLGLLALRPALSGGWLWDDGSEVFENTILKDPAGVAKIWLSPPGPDYFPLKSTVQWLEWRAWGAEPFGYHAVSLALHLASALLVWRLLRRLGAPWAWLGGLLFAIHPLAVESVAWAAELKNTLSLPLMLLAMDAWLDYDAARRPSAYVRAFLFFLLAMLAKSSVVMLPAVFLLHAWWKRGRIGARDFVATAPFLAVSAALGAVTLRFQYRVAIAAWTIDAGGPAARLLRASISAGFYFFKCLVPAGLSPLYSPSVVAPSPAHLLPLAALIAVAALCWSRRASWGKHALLGLGFLVINLLPIVGLADMSYMRYSWVADHFAYISIIGAAGLAAAALGALARTSPVPAVLAATAIAGAFAAESRGYSSVFHDSGTLWNYALGRDPASWAALDNLADAEVKAGDLKSGIAHYEEAIRIRPDLAEAHSGLGYALLLVGRPADAVVHLREAVRLGYVKAHTNLGNALAQTGDLDAAIREQQEAVRLQPDSAETFVNLGNALTQAGRVPEALPQYETALRLQPDFSEGRYNWAIALAQAGRLPDAAAQLELAAREAPSNPRIWNEWGAILAQSGRLAAAGEHFERAAELAPNYAAAQINLGNVLLQENRPLEAIPHYEAALRIDPGMARVRQNLEYARQQAAR